jgi:hypothetical protein
MVETVTVTVMETVMAMAMETVMAMAMVTSAMVNKLIHSSMCSPMIIVQKEVLH